MDGRGQDGREEYFDLIFDEFKRAGLLPGANDGVWRMDFEDYFQFLAFDPVILEQVAQTQGGRFRNVLLVNSKKNVLLCEQFGAPKDKLLLRTAAYFTLLGCVLDDMADHGGRAQKAEALGRLRWDYCREYLVHFQKAKDDSLTELLFGQLSEGFRRMRELNEKRYERVLQMVHRAVRAEAYAEGAGGSPGWEEMAGNAGGSPGWEKMAGNAGGSSGWEKMAGNAGGCPDLQEPWELDMVLDKSVLFAEISSEIALAGCADLSDDGRRILACIGRLFAWVDDVCDYYEDQKSGQKNLMAVHAAGSGITAAARRAVRRIAADLEDLREHTDSCLYDFIFHEIKEWTLSSRELRERIWKWQIS